MPDDPNLPKSPVVIPALAPDDATELVKLAALIQGSRKRIASEVIASGGCARRQMHRHYRRSTVLLPRVKRCLTCPLPGAGGPRFPGP
jgi:hypothetical protein